MAEQQSEKKVTYIHTLDGETPIEWWEKEHFSGRVNRMYTAESGEDLIEGKNLKLVHASPIPDSLILCDFCNEKITEFPVPVMNSSYALCKKCFQDVQKGGKEQIDERKCPYCDDPLTILARHDYQIGYDEEQHKWVKDVGEVQYVCNNCYEVLDTHDLEDILKQVDEV